MSFRHGFHLLVLLLSLAPRPAGAQQEFVVTIETSAGDTTETFWIQIPQGYHPATPCPLLIGWHQWGGDYLEMRDATTLEEEANARTWIVASHNGVGPTHWNNHLTQSHVVDMIRWIEAHYSVDSTRIYMIGASMGGAAGMVFSNNHQDPAGVRVAAAVSISGIQDCERRFQEQGINNSMIAAFGGTPEEVPFEYRRNSAVCFADSTASMHYNARHLPLLLTFGRGDSDQPWRSHAEDLYAVLSPYADTVAIRESSLYGHGWGCTEAGFVCDFLSGFSLPSPPRGLSINADEEGRWGWADCRMREGPSSFARFEATVDPDRAEVSLTMIRNLSSATLDLQSAGFPAGFRRLACLWEVLDGTADLTLRELPTEPACVFKDSQPFTGWVYDPTARTLLLPGQEGGLFAVFEDPAASPDPGPAGPAPSPPRLHLDGRGQVRLHTVHGGEMAWTLVDLLGRRQAASGPLWVPPGSTTLPMPGSLPSGIYFLVLETSGVRPGRTALRVPIVR